MITEFIKTLLPILTLVANILFVLILGLWIYAKGTKKDVPALAWIKTHLLPFSAVVAIVATCGSLFYSEVAGYNPCKMCWLQRIFMYPQAIILPLAHIWNDKKIFRYTLPLSVLGLILAIYHYLLQIGVLITTSCSTVGFSLSCSDRFFMNYGYITIPMMAISAFALLILFALLSKEKQA